MPEIGEDFKEEDFSKNVCLKTFKTPNQLVLEMTFDPSSKFLAAGTSDSQIKIFDVEKNFQTHNFIGHRGIIQKLVFFPETDSLKLISCAEDFVIRVWDLVFKKEVATMKPKGEDNMAHMTTSICFTNDKKTMISAGRDSCIHFWNTRDNFKHISSVKIESLGALKYDEVNCMVYVNHVKEDPCLIIGGASGQVCIYSIKRQEFVHRANESRILATDEVIEDGTERTNEICQL